MTARSPGDQPSELDRVLVQLAVAITCRTLYAPQHPSVERSLRDLVECVTAACDDRGSDRVTFLFLDEEVVAEGRPLRRRGAYVASARQALLRSGVNGLTLGRGLELDESARLVEALVTGSGVTGSPHVAVGRAERPGESGDEEGQLTSAQVDRAREAFCRFRGDETPPLDPLEELVWSGMELLARAGRPLLPLVPLRHHDEYTFVHSVNVALLVLAQGRAFGLGGPVLHAIGMAALLHDIGKLAIPLSVLNKPGRLDGDEWRLMMAHVVRGAEQLCRQQQLAPLGVLVAYEHHLRYDGQPSYPPLRVARPPTLASQLTAVADVYDAVRTVRPYRQALPADVVLDLVRARAGTFHDPLLVASLCRLIDPAGPA